MKRVARLVTLYMRERMYATVYVVRNKEYLEGQPWYFAGYHEPPLYHWNEEYLEGQPWYEVRLTIPARTQAPF